MKFTFERTEEYFGTSRQGYVDAGYRELVATFGRPTEGDGYKVDAQWAVRFSDGTVATIYNYKDGKNYNGRSGTPKTKIREWHIGGYNKAAVTRVLEALGK